MYITNLEVLGRLFSIVGLLPILVVLLIATIFIIYATSLNNLSDKYWASVAFPYLVVVSIVLFSCYGVYKGKHEILEYNKVVEGKYIGTTSNGTESTYYMMDKTIYQPNPRVIFANSIIPFCVGIFLLVILFKHSPEKHTRSFFIIVSLLLFAKCFSMIYFGMSFVNRMQDNKRTSSPPAFERVIINRDGESLPVVITEEDNSYELLEKDE